MSTYTDLRAAAIPTGGTDRTPPNSGLTIVFTTEHGAAYRCLACNAGTGVGAYDLSKTRKAAQMHREESCPHPGAHHITRTVVDVGSQKERFRIKSNGSCGRWVVTDDSVALCACGWKELTNTRAEARSAARVHRDEARSAWLDARTASAVAGDAPARDLTHAA